VSSDFVGTRAGGEVAERNRLAVSTAQEPMGQGFASQASFPLAGDGGRRSRTDTGSKTITATSCLMRPPNPTGRRDPL